MEQLFDRHATTCVFAVPGQVVGHLALKRDLVFGSLLQDEQGSELLGDGGDAEPRVWRVGRARSHVGIADPLGVDDLAVVGDQNRPVEVAVLLVIRDQALDSLRFTGSRDLAGGKGR